MITITEEEFSKIVEFVKTNYGVNLIKKKTLILGRLQNYIINHGYESFTEYFNKIINDKSGNELSEFISRVTTNHTFFMRESDHFEYFKDYALPEWIQRQLGKRDLRIWSAGCSTGEEAYTLAMIVKDFLGCRHEQWDTKILATDISERVLKKAVEGIYHNDGLVSVPEKWRKKYFSPVGEEQRMISDELKKEIIFRKFNLIQRCFPFKKKLHIIFCRNVMIYFDPETKEELVNKFYDNLESGGYLFIGHSESINRDKSKFKYIIPAVYKKE